MHLWLIVINLTGHALDQQIYNWDLRCTYITAMICVLTC